MRSCCALDKASKWSRWADFDCGRQNGWQTRWTWDHFLRLDMNDIILKALTGRILKMKLNRQRKSNHKQLSNEVFTYS